MNASSYYLEMTVLRLLGYILTLENLQQLKCPLIVAKLQKLLLVNHLPDVLHLRISCLSVLWNLNPLKGRQQIEEKLMANKKIKQSFLTLQVYKIWVSGNSGYVYFCDTPQQPAAIRTKFWI